MQVEYATDVVFHRQGEFQPLYAALTHTAIHAVKPDHIATFLGRKLTAGYQDELGNDFSPRIEGTRIRHSMGQVAIKLYDKFALLARVECTANDVTFFQHHRRVEHRDGTREFKLAPVRKSIYGLPVLRAGAATFRYLDFLATIEDPRPGLRALEKIATPVHDGERSYRGFNLFHGPARQLRPHLPACSGGQLSRCLKRLRTHGLIKKIGERYKYYLTTLGRTVATTALKLRALVVIPMLNQPVAA